MTREGMYGHWQKGHDYEPSDRLKMRYILLTLPKVPSAISCTTVYSPSFDGGMTGTGSCSLIVAVILGRVRRPDELPRPKYLICALFGCPLSSHSTMSNFWLMKAEPNSRIVKGKDVKVGLSELPSFHSTHQLQVQCGRL
jgi:hypothetical protein